MSPVAVGDSAGATGAAALLHSLYAAPDAKSCEVAAQALTEYVSSSGIRVLHSDNILDDLVRASKSKSGYEREGSMVGMDHLFRTLGREGGYDPYFIPLLSPILERFQETGQGAVVKDAAEKAAKQLVRLAPPEASPKTLDALFAIVEGGAKWKTKVGALDLIGGFATRAKEQVAERLGEIIPKLSEAMQDTKPEVSKAAIKATTAICSVMSNPDVQPFIPVLVSAMARPDTVAETIKKLSANVWVRDVDGPTLAVLVPLLARALSERATNVQRLTVILISNLFKLVRSQDLAAIYVPPILPGVTRIAESASFPEIREFASEARQSMINSIGGDESVLKAAANGDVKEGAKEEDEKLALSSLEDLVEKETGSHPDQIFKISLAYVAFAIAALVRRRDFDEKQWHGIYISPYLSKFMPAAKVEGISREVRRKWVEIDRARNAKKAGDDDGEEGVELTNLPFSLAYGGLLLLNNTVLKLYRGRRYGVCGANGAGKSTLLKAIDKHQIDGFPENVSTFYVQHDIDGVTDDISVLNFMIADKKVLAVQADEKRIKDTLTEMGFDDDRQATPVGALSGGWKMRLALARAMICRADLLLLDEPTNHLDRRSVEWLQDYLLAQKDVTVMVVSHDSGFLDAICTDIIHYETKQLVYYKGNLAKFVEKNPAAKTYYSLAAAEVKFSFPPPGALSGVRSNTRAILKVTNATFTYPNAPKPSLHNASCAVSLSSRVGVIGPNGAGKSTLIKLLTGDTIPDSGKVEKHPNLRIAIVHQHAFHHIEQHMEKSAVKYIQWRYEHGVDKELSMKATRILSDEEKAQLETPITSTTGESRKVEMVMGRQKLKKSYTYEIKWRNLDHKHNTWIPRERLLELGFSKLVQSFDDFEASREGSGSREMSAKLVRKHLEDLGLDGDIAEYNELKGLSGGQKVKVVIGAAMWSKPQVLILDEPTNFLDRSSLAGLATAIRDWAGAFVCISHNEEFVGALCPEIWNVDAGRLTQKGKVAIVEDAFDEGVATPGGSSRATTAPNSRGATAPSSAANSGGEEPSANGTSTPPVKSKKKKMTRKQMKDREERRRLRTLAWLSSSIPGTTREPDTDTDDE